MKEEKIVQIEDYGYGETYDLEVEHEEHSFFANDISVSNSHSVAYALTSYQCAWLLHYYPTEFITAFLEKEPEDRKEKALNLVKRKGYKVEPLCINSSEKRWSIKSSKVLIQPLLSIKGLGESAIEQILLNRPFNTVEDLLFSEKVIYSKLNKKSLDVLTKSGALDCIITKDSRFNHLRHFWLSCVNERPLSRKKMLEAIEKHRNERDFSDEEKIEFITDLTGIFPLEMVVSERMQKELKKRNVNPISANYNLSEVICWCIPRSIEVKTTRNGKRYFQLFVTDSNFSLEMVRCWGIDPKKDKIYLNRPYMVNLKYNEEWGFSTNGFVSRSWKLLG